MGDDTEKVTRKRTKEELDKLPWIDVSGTERLYIEPRQFGFGGSGSVLINASGTPLTTNLGPQLAEAVEHVASIDFNEVAYAPQTETYLTWDDDGIVVTCERNACLTDRGWWRSEHLPSRCTPEAAAQAIEEHRATHSAWGRGPNTRIMTPADGRTVYGFDPGTDGNHGVLVTGRLSNGVLYIDKIEEVE